MTNDKQLTHQTYFKDDESFKNSKTQESPFGIQSMVNINNKLETKE